MVKIVTDSTADLPAEIVQKLGISIVPLIVETDGAALIDGITITRQQFYANLSQYRELPKTASPSPDVFASVYRANLQGEDDEVVAIHLNSKFSSVYDSAKLAAASINAGSERVHVIDSETVTMGLGWLALVADQMARSGASAKSIIEKVESLRSHIRIYALMDTLRYLRKGGRANAVVAGIGDLLQVKILLRVQNGSIEQIDRIRTRARGIARMIDVAHRYRSYEHLSVLFTTTNGDNEIKNLQNQLKDLIPVDQQFAMQVTPIIGTHVGPMALGLAIAADV
ncbi:MAG TPA: DegV family protein [Anaerolineae bacterium]